MQSPSPLALSAAVLVALTALPATAQPLGAAPPPDAPIPEVVEPAPSSLIVEPSTTSPESPEPPAPADTSSSDIIVVGRSRADQLRRSEQPVTVVELSEARRAPTDLGELLARTVGVSIQRLGGLGSQTRVSLAGLEDEQVRLFIDGVPLDLAGYPIGIGNMPVNLIERVEIYSGVVPIRFGADALGGAVQLVTRAPKPGTHGWLSYQAGSFDTHRLTLSASHRDPSGLLVSLFGFGDSAENDYRVTVSVPSEDGTLNPARVNLFHNGYRAAGANLSIGYLHMPWAERLVLRLHATLARREMQNDAAMVTEYGEAEEHRDSAGATLSYKHMFAESLEVEAVAGYTLQLLTVRDLSLCDYDWYGRCAFVRTAPGEVEQDYGTPDLRNARFRTHGAFARLNGRVHLGEQQSVALSLAPTYSTRDGEERWPEIGDDVDELARDQSMLSLVTGVEYELRAFSDRLQASAFGKQYSQRARGSEVVESASGARELERDTLRAGGGAALRYAPVPELWAKASYEYATRLPTMDEVFGSGATINPNLQLEPEISHNLNLTLATDLPRGALGGLRAELTGFYRDIEDYVGLIVTSLVQRYDNVQDARSIGVQATTSWTAPGGDVSADLNATYQDFRNRAQSGVFANFHGRRIVNRPYLFGTARVQFQPSGVFADGDRFVVSWNTRYTHEFSRLWERLGRESSRQSVPSQLVHTLGFIYSIGAPNGAGLSASLDLQNLTDARVFDTYGIERPGRAAYFKFTVER